MIRSFKPQDTQALLDIYNYYVKETVITFDLEPFSLIAFKNKLNKINDEYPFLVYEENNEILGYAYGSKWRPKPAYNNTVESTIYLKHNAHGRRIGTKLYKALFTLLKDKGYHTVVGGLTYPNKASEHLHEKMGFKKVAHFKEVGYKFDQWLDVAFYQLDLNKFEAD